jgi:hypothetical protein
MLVMSQAKVAEFDSPANLLENAVSGVRWSKLRADGAVVHFLLASPGGGSWEDLAGIGCIYKSSLCVSYPPWAVSSKNAAFGPIVRLVTQSQVP